MKVFLPLDGARSPANHVVLRSVKTLLKHTASTRSDGVRVARPAKQIDVTMRMC